MNTLHKELDLQRLTLLKMFYFFFSATYEFARSKISEAELTSNIDSENDYLKPRIKKKESIHLPGESSTDNEDEMNRRCQLLSDNKMKQKVKKRKTSSQSSSSLLPDFPSPPLPFYQNEIYSHSQSESALKQNDVPTKNGNQQGKLLIV